ncbi:MAG: hypothetical protein QNJ68_08690 [Microcoleaceae cyanobacterium MO_207.B10]|nr:hypothetical protein [Microcoleaceae cyanobacterium MO_207.B10]
MIFVKRERSPITIFQLLPVSLREKNLTQYIWIDKNLSDIFPEYWFYQQSSEYLLKSIDRPLSLFNFCQFHSHRKISLYI